MKRTLQYSQSQENVPVVLSQVSFKASVSNYFFLLCNVVTPITELSDPPSYLPNTLVPRLDRDNRVYRHCQCIAVIPSYYKLELVRVHICGHCIAFALNNSTINDCTKQKIH